MIRFLSIASWAAFGVSLLVHVLTFLPDLGAYLGPAVALHFVSLGLSAVMVLDAGRLRWRLRPGPVTEPSARWRGAQGRSVGEVLVEVILIGLLIYLLVVLLTHSSAGVPGEQDGRYVLFNHRVLAELTEDEFARLQASRFRAASALWVLFTLLPAIYFSFLRPALPSPARGAETDPDANSQRT
jgi:hypothetical protein